MIYRYVRVFRVFRACLLVFSVPPKWAGQRRLFRPEAGARGAGGAYATGPGHHRKEALASASENQRKVTIGATYIAAMRGLVGRAPSRGGRESASSRAAIKEFSHMGFVNQ